MTEPRVPAAMDSRRERTESARLDNFVDGAFAFAITLLVISGASLPRNAAALEHALLGVPAFAACFAQLALFWHGHVRWRDTLRLTDRASLLLSLLLVFFALIFVFPLHLVYSGALHGWTGGILSPDFEASANPIGDWRALFICFGLSYACMAGTLATLFRHGARMAVASSREDGIAVRVGGAAWAMTAAVGLFSALVALAARGPAAGLMISIAGFSYLLMMATGAFKRRYRARLEAGMPP